MKRTLYIDDGHGMETNGKRTPWFKKLFNILFKNGRNGARQIRENEFNSAVAKKLATMAEAIGFRIVFTAPGDTDVPLKKRSSIVNSDFKNVVKSNRDKAALVSIHFNAFDGKWGTNKGGVETHHYPGSTAGTKLARLVQNELIKGTKQINRGVKASNFHILRVTYMPAILVEAGFMDVEYEALLMLDEDFQKEVTEEILSGLVLYFDEVDPQEEIKKGYPIIGTGVTTIKQMKQWAKDRKANKLFIDLAPLYFEIAMANGCDPGVAYCLSAKETGFMHFGGVLDASYNNPCGLKTTAGGGDYSKSAHKVFDSWRDGISALVDHLLLYAGADGYPKADTLDPRHFKWLHGYSNTVEGLDIWSSSKTYGYDLVKLYINTLLVTQVQEQDELTVIKSLNSELSSENDKLNAKIEYLSNKLNNATLVLEELLKSLK